MLGYTVVEPGAVLATHLTEVCRRHADEILTRDATKHLVDELKQTQPAVVGELIPGVMSLAEVQAVLHLLLREQVPIRQLGVDPRNARRLRPRAPRTRSCSPNTSAIAWPGRSAPATATPRASCTSSPLDPAMEDRIRAGFEHNERGLFIRMSPQAVEATCQRDRQATAKAHHRRPHADRAREPANPRRAQAAHRKPPAAARGPQLQRSHPRHASRHPRPGERRVKQNR